MQGVLSQNAGWIGEAIFQGKLFLVHKFPGAICSSDPDDIVKGDLFELQKPELLQRLDRYERFNPNREEESLFVRKREQIRLLSGEEEFEAWIYLYNRPTAHLTPIKSGDYLNFIGG